MLKFLRPWLVIAAAAALVACAGPQSSASRSAAESQARLVLSDDGLSEITASGLWQTRPGLSRSADIRLSNTFDDHHLLVNTYRPGDLEEMSFAQMAERINKGMLKNIEAGRMSPAQATTVGGRPAIAHELRGKLGSLELVYYSVMVDGQRARYHLVGWASAGSDSADVRQLMAGFRESAKPRRAQQRVNLDFKWPSQLKARATFKQKTVKRKGGYEMQGEMLMRVKPQGDDELVISTEVTRHNLKSGATNKDKDFDAYLQDVMRTLMADVPDYVVNRDGEFVRVTNLAEYHQRIQKSLIKGLPQGNPEALAKAQEMVKASLTEETLAVALRSGWNEMVELWADGSYVPGHRYEFTQGYQADALGEQEFPMNTTQKLVGSVPCRPNAAPTSCVRLMQESRVDGPEYTAAMDAYVRSKVGHGVRVKKMEIVNTLEVIADPRTLLPYFTHKKEIKRVTIEAEGKTTVNEDVEDTEVSYRY